MRQHSSSQPYCAPDIYRIRYCRHVEAELLGAIVQLRQDVLVGSRTRVFTRPSSVFRTFLFAGRIFKGPNTRRAKALLFFLVQEPDLTFFLILLLVVDFPLH